MEKRWIFIAIGVAGLGIVAVSLLRRPSASAVSARRPAKVTPAAGAAERDWRAGPVVTVPQAKPDFKPAEAKELGRALDQASIQSLIDNLRVASEGDDDTTMRAMIEGLRRRGAPARAMVEREMASLPADSKGYFAMKQVLR